jgi:hypothetical protein
VVAVVVAILAAAMVESLAETKAAARETAFWMLGGGGGVKECEVLDGGGVTGKGEFRKGTGLGQDHACVELPVGQRCPGVWKHETGALS